MHKKIIEKALGNLPPDRSTYFGNIANRLEQDKRIENNANMVYTILKDVMPELPIYLEQKELIDLLFEFTDKNYNRLKDALYDPEFVRDPTSIRRVTGGFVHQVVKLSLERHENGEFEEPHLSVHKLSWPYRDTDVVDPDEDPDAWADAVSKNEKWRLEHGGVDRRRGGAARIDDVANDIAAESEQQEKNKPSS